MLSAFLGVDPGAKGAICALFSDGEFQFMDLSRPIHDWKSFFEKIDSEADNIAPVCIEDVHSLLGMSAKSNFSFGFNVGQINALIDLSRLGKDPVKPKAWQKVLGVPQRAKGKEVKAAVKEGILRLYPNAREMVHGPKGGYLDGRGDALGIAHYCRVSYGGLGS